MLFVFVFGWLLDQWLTFCCCSTLFAWHFWPWKWSANHRKGRKRASKASKAFIILKVSRWLPFILFLFDSLINYLHFVVAVLSSSCTHGHENPGRTTIKVAKWGSNSFWSRMIGKLFLLFLLCFLLIVGSINHLLLFISSFHLVCCDHENRGRTTAKVWKGWKSVSKAHIIWQVSRLKGFCLFLFDCWISDLPFVLVVLYSHGMYEHEIHEQTIEELKRTGFKGLLTLASIIGKHGEVFISWFCLIVSSISHHFALLCFVSTWVPPSAWLLNHGRTQAHWV